MPGDLAKLEPADPVEADLRDSRLEFAVFDEIEHADEVTILDCRLRGASIDFGAYAESTVPGRVAHAHLVTLQPTSAMRR